MVTLVTAPVFMAATALKVPLWPSTPNGHTKTAGGELLWLPVVMRPLTVIFFSFVCMIVAWGFNWSNRSHAFFGITLSSSIASVCFVSLCYLAFSVSSIERRIRTTDFLQQASDQKDGRVVALGVFFFYLWGLTIEWSTTHKYVLWTLITFILFLLIRLFLSLLRLDMVKAYPDIVPETAWSRGTFALYVLLIMLFGLILVEVFSYLFHSARLVYAPADNLWWLLA
jgi:hypothetical protein